MPRKLWEPQFPIQPKKFPFFYGWMIVAVASVGIVFSIPGQTMGFSVFTDTLMNELGLTRVQLSTAYCIGTVMSGFTLPILGVLFDKFGARRMIVYASVATGVILFYLSGVRPLLDALAGPASSLGIGRMPVGFALITFGFYLIRASAQGVLTMTSRNVIGKWFDHDRGTALAVSGAMTAFAFSIAPVALNAIKNRFGYDGAWQVLGVLTIVVMAVVGWMFIRDSPEECGMVMDGGDKASGKKPNEDMIIHRDYGRGEAMRTWPLWAFNLSFAFYALFGTAFTFHIESIGAEAGRAPSEVFSYFIPMSIVSVGANLAAGWISSRTRLKYLLAIMNVAAFVGVLGVMHIATGPGLFAYIAGNGLCSGLFVALSGIVWPRFFGRTFLGAISGVNMSSMVIGSGVGPLVFSLSISGAGSYNPILWICGMVPIALFFGSFFADNPQRRAK